MRTHKSSSCRRCSEFAYLAKIALALLHGSPSVKNNSAVSQPPPFPAHEHLLVTLRGCTPSDEFQADSDFAALQQATQYGYMLGMDIANQERLPDWRPGGQFSRMRPGLFLFFFSAAALLPAQNYLTDVRQLTHGGENAEAYWSPDGRRLIFQATRAPYGCDQIFIMNADGSNPHLVSTGKGRTTCAYFVDGKRILYASTHLGSPACPTPPDRSKGYVWGIFRDYDIFLATDTGKILKRLTEAPGYDAEATVNWKTETVVYTSVASGDLDLWSMRTDGSDKRQITHKIGYDGGGVFSRDGKKLVWRAHYPKTAEDLARYKSLLADALTAPMKMEIMVADADGSHARQITDFGCASFAPTFTPDGKQILFSSNRHDCDSRHFELYLINVDGTGLRKVTDSGGFTSFPEFSPDGRTLVFCSDRGAKTPYEFNIFTARWR